MAAKANDLRQHGSVAVGYRGDQDYQSVDRWESVQDASSPFVRKLIMQLNSLFRRVLVAYACAASGSAADDYTG